MNPSQLYPSPGFHFSVQFEGIGNLAVVDTRFQEVSGLSAELTTEELTVGGENRFVYKLPVRTKFPNLVLKRGMPVSVTSPVINWVRDALYNFDFRLCNVQVTLLNEKHLPSAAWKFSNVYPVKWNISDLKAMENAIVIETLELTFQASSKMASLF